MRENPSSQAKDPEASQLRLLAEQLTQALPEFEASAS